MKICSECGARNADHSFLCNQCGKPLGPAEDEESTGDTDQIPRQGEPTPEDLVTEATDELSDGNPSEAVGLCERALELRPEYVPAFALLGMAHEEMDNLEAALSAYENVVRIDPSRSVERRKVNMIKLQLMRTDGEGRDAGQRSKWGSRYGPTILAVGAALLVFVVGAWLIINTGTPDAQQQSAAAYEQAMTLGTEAMADGKYEKAVLHFQAALEARPEDRRARTRIQRARQMITDQTSRSANLPTYLPSRGPNPFQPVVVPGEDEDQQDSAADAGPGVPVPDPTTNRPRSVYRRQQGSSRSRSTPDASGSSSDTSTSSTPRQGDEGEPISPVRTEGGESQPSPAPEETTDTQQASAAEDPGEIRIWASDEPPPETESSGSTQSAADPDALRSKADRLRSQGNCQQATDYYNRAIEGYRQRMENQPALSESARRAVESCQTGRELCESE